MEVKEPGKYLGSKHKHSRLIGALLINSEELQSLRFRPPWKVIYTKAPSMKRRAKDLVLLEKRIMTTSEDRSHLLYLRRF
jgi:hypothetical protein